MQGRGFERVVASLLVLGLSLSGCVRVTEVTVLSGAQGLRMVPVPALPLRAGSQGKGCRVAILPTRANKSPIDLSGVDLLLEGEASKVTVRSGCSVSGPLTVERLVTAAKLTGNWAQMLRDVASGAMYDAAMVQQVCKTTRADLLVQTELRGVELDATGQRLQRGRGITRMLDCKAGRPAWVVHTGVASVAFDTRRTQRRIERDTTAADNYATGAGLIAGIGALVAIIGLASNSDSAVGLGAVALLPLAGIPLAFRVSSRTTRVDGKQMVGVFSGTSAAIALRDLVQQGLVRALIHGGVITGTPSRVQASLSQAQRSPSQAQASSAWFAGSLVPRSVSVSDDNSFKVCKAQCNRYSERLFRSLTIAARKLALRCMRRCIQPAAIDLRRCLRDNLAKRRLLSKPCVIP